MAFMKTLVRQKQELTTLENVTSDTMFSARQPYLLQTVMMNKESDLDPDFSLIQAEAEQLLELFRSACSHQITHVNGVKRADPISLINSEGVCWCCGLHEDDFPAVCEVCGDLCGWSVGEAASWCSADCADNEKTVSSCCEFHGRFNNPQAWSMPCGSADWGDGFRIITEDDQVFNAWGHEIKEA